MLDELKNYLDVTWSDDSTDAKLSGILERAENTLRSYAGYEPDFAADSHEKQLLFDCCRYIYNNSFEDFSKNFRSELIMLRANHAAKNYDPEENNE